MKRPRLEPPAIRLGLAILGFGLWAAYATVHAPVKAADFYVFWAAARHTGAPYDPSLAAALQAQFHIGGRLPFVYPPTFLLLAWPFGRLPLALAYPLWTGLSAAAFMFAAAHLVRPAWLTLALFIAPPVVLAIAPGQTSLLVGAAMIGGWLLLERRPAMAGVLFGLAACIKPQAMILAPILLLGHWRAMAWALAAAAAAVLASLPFGAGRWTEWAHALAAFQALAPATERVNPSALAPWLGPPLALLGVWIAWTWRDLVGLAAGALCVTPYAHAYDLAPLAPLALSWLADYRQRGYPLAAIGAALLAGLVATPLAGLLFVTALAAVKLPGLELPWPPRSLRGSSPAGGA